MDVEDVEGLVVPSWLLLRLPCDPPACDAQPGDARGGEHDGRRGGGTEAEALQADA